MDESLWRLFAKKTIKAHKKTLKFKYIYVCNLMAIFEL